MFPGRLDSAGAGNLAVLQPCFLHTQRASRPAARASVPAAVADRRRASRHLAPRDQRVSAALRRAAPAAPYADGCEQIFLPYLM